MAAWVTLRPRAQAWRHDAQTQARHRPRGAWCCCWLRDALRCLTSSRTTPTRGSRRSTAYDGHVGDIDIHLWRGAYSIDDIVIVKTGAKRPVPFFSSRRVDLSVEWRSLLRGSIVAEAEFDGPEINLVQGKSKADSQLGEEENWNARLEETVSVPLQHHRA